MSRQEEINQNVVPVVSLLRSNGHHLSFNETGVARALKKVQERDIKYLKASIPSIEQAKKLSGAVNGGEVLLSIAEDLARNNLAAVEEGLYGLLFID